MPGPSHPQNHGFSRLGTHYSPWLAWLLQPAGRLPPARSYSSPPCNPRPILIPHWSSGSAQTSHEQKPIGEPFRVLPWLLSTESLRKCARLGLLNSKMGVSLQARSFGKLGKGDTLGQQVLRQITLCARGKILKIISEAPS